VPGSALGRFTNTSDYETGLRDLSAIITPLRPGPFSASLVRADLSLIRLMRVQESGPRIAFLSIPNGWRYAIFLTQPGPQLIWNGEALSVGDMMLTEDGEQLHQRTSGAASIGVIAVPGQMLEHYFDGLIGRPLTLSSEASIVSLQTSQNQQLLRLHARIGRVVETRPKTIWHPEAARAIEQEVIESMVTCLENGIARRTSAQARTIGPALAALEGLLAHDSDQYPSMRNICTALGITESELQSFCAASLDMSPSHYVELYSARLNKASNRR
jgi:hypothetical protein